MSIDEQTRDLTRWLGDGGMPLLGHLGVSFEGFDATRVWGHWTPSELCCNPRGAVQAGVYTVVLDAAMSLAILATLPKGEFAVSLDVHTSTIRPALRGDELRVVGRVIKRGRAAVFAEASAINISGEEIAECRGAYVVQRRRPAESD